MFWSRYKKIIFNYAPLSRGFLTTPQNGPYYMKHIRLSLAVTVADTENKSLLLLFFYPTNKPP